ncbi:MAG: polyprenyl synthetase, partial [Planctomycetota bacterium]
NPETPFRDRERIATVRSLYESAGVFDAAHQLVDKHQQRAEALADDVENDHLRRLLYFLIDTVLERPETQSNVAAPALVQLQVS